MFVVCNLFCCTISLKICLVHSSVSLSHLLMCSALMTITPYHSQMTIRNFFAEQCSRQMLVVAWDWDLNQIVSGRKGRSPLSQITGL